MCNLAKSSEVCVCYVTEAKSYIERVSDIFGRAPIVCANGLSEVC